MATRLYPIFSKSTEETEIEQLARFLMVTEEVKKNLLRAKALYKKCEAIPEFFHRDRTWGRIWEVIHNSYPEVEEVLDFDLYGWGRFDMNLLPENTDWNVGETYNLELADRLIRSASFPMTLTPYQRNMLIGVGWS